MVVFFAAASDGIVNENLVGEPFIFKLNKTYNDFDV